MPGKRMVETRPQAPGTSRVQLELDTDLGTVPINDDPGKQYLKFEFKCVLNRGETMRILLADPLYTMINQRVGPGEEENKGRKYYKESRKNAPMKMRAKLSWAGAEEPLTTGWVDHSMVGVAPYGESGSTGRVEFLCIDYASFYLNGGDASGDCYRGNVKDVIQAVVNKYSRGDLTVEFRTKVKDNPNNKWYMMRMDPKTFIISMLNWATSVADKRSRWMIYPDDHKLIFVEEAGITSIHRATYFWRGHFDQGGHGDIVEWEQIGDNAIQMYKHKVVTQGISAISGAYHDRVTDQNQKKVFVGDVQTPTKKKPKTDEDRAFTRPNPMANPLDESVGWTSVLTLPEHSAGDVGIPYDGYIDGYARNAYLRLYSLMHRCRFRIIGHHIWAGSEGLGVDTIKIVMFESDNVTPHFLNGNWIVYGFHHIVERGQTMKWFTDLYCMRRDWDADAEPVGK